MSFFTRPIFYIILAIILVIGAFLIFKNGQLFPSITGGPTTISGTIDLNGQPPAGSTVTLSQRLDNQGQFQPFAQGLPAQDGVAWSWNQAKSGANYDVQAQILSNGQVIATSDTIVVTAPATEESLRLNYSAPVTPVTATPSPTPAPQPASITGTLDLNGYIPGGSMVTLQQQTTGSTASFQTIGSPFAAQDGVAWIWKEALTNQTYNIQAILTNASGAQIGFSQILTVSAPAAKESLRINSTAQPPATPSSSPQTTTSTSTGNAVVSGSINLNGVTPPGGSIVILERTPPGSGNFQTVVSGVSPTNGATWSWNQAVSGTQYEIVGVVKNSSDADMGVSASVIVSAPASNELITINSNYSLPSPTNLPSVTCTNKNQSNNTWTATINYPTIPGAQTYWLQLGSTSTGSDITNITQAGSNGTYQTVNATLTDSTYYYARYAYSLSPNVSMGSNFSAFSNTATIQCQQ